MHEFSLVKALLSQSATIAAEHGGAPVAEICLEIGPLSGFEPTLVHEAFEILVADTPLAGARLVIHEIPLSGVCRQCNHEFAIEQFRFQCPVCGSPAVRVVSGDAVRLVSLTLRDVVPATVPSEACSVEATTSLGISS